MPTTPKATGGLLQKLRECMTNTKYVPEALNAYIVPSADSHGSEYLAECHKRMAFISGFTGSAGTAIITQEHACLWTDGRYFLQASEEMDENWTLMKEGLTTTPKQATWLCQTLKTGSVVGVDPNLLSHHTWIPFKDQLESAGHKLISVETNLIDLIWEDRPQESCNPVHPLPLKFTGKSVCEKLQDIRSKMQEKHASVLVLTFLDEIAWFLNMRGSDIEFNPVFFSFVIIRECHFTLFIDEQKYTSEVEAHLKHEAGDEKFNVKPYSEIRESLKQQLKDLKGRVWICRDANYSLSSLVPNKCSIRENTPIQLMKAIKNSIEIQGMCNAHIKDAAALCCYFAWLEKNVPSGNVTEISGADQLEKFRAMQADFKGPSFDTISSVGPHGAIIHYTPTKSSDVPIRTDCIYLCDSGGQYRDGTTDVTRTLHFGTPTDHERECFTRVLKGQIKLGTSVFPSKVRGNYLDSFAREYLWEVGLDYGHGTGHGIGSYLNVHEGPIEVSWRTTKEDPGLDVGMFISNEPGYYENGAFGIRIEDIVQIVPAKTKHNFNNRGFLTFETVTLVPIQTKMMDVKLMTEREVAHINGYHQRCRDVVGPLLEKQGHVEAKEWLWRETEPICK